MVKPDEKLHKHIGAAIRSRRKQLQISQEALADAIHLSRSSVANIECGRQKITVESLFEIARILQIPPTDLLPNVSDPAQNKPPVSLPEDISEQKKAWVNQVLMPIKETKNNESKLENTNQSRKKQAR